MNEQKRGVPPVSMNKFNSLVGHVLDATGELRHTRQPLNFLVFATHYLHGEKPRNVITLVIPYVSADEIDYAIFSANNVADALNLAARYHSFVDKDERNYEFNAIMQENTVTTF